MERKRSGLVERIGDFCNEWIEQNLAYQREGMEHRRALAKGGVEMVRCLVGALVSPRFSAIGSGEIYMFEGLRNVGYIPAFPTSSVVIIGSHEERAYAAKNGHGFIWSFPVEAAVRAKVYRNWDFFLAIQIRRWLGLMRSARKVVVFIYEDTQALGVFLTQICHEQVNSTTVCIQHGYFCRVDPAVRYEGALSDVNFVWDGRQARLLGDRPGGCFVIGLPYVAKAAAATDPKVVLVGVGAPYANPGHYSETLESYSRLTELIRGGTESEVVYRPHPTELSHDEVMKNLRTRFSEIDTTDKVERLNGGRSVFVGTVSSLLYEAKIAGHLVVSIDIDQRQVPIFDCDLRLTSSCLEAIIGWLRGISGNDYCESGSSSLDCWDSAPFNRFMRAIEAARLCHESR